MAKMIVARALTARVAGQFVRFATIAVLAIFGIVFLLTWGLAHFFSVWWWLLLLPFILVVGIFFIIRLIVVLILRRIHTPRLTREQSAALDAFTDKIQSLLEARAMPPWLIGLVCLKDIVIHHDITTIKRLIRDTTSLQREYKELEKIFVES